MFKSKIFNIIVGCFLFTFLFFTGISCVNAKTTRTGTLDLTSLETQNNLATEGWSWNSDTKILKLENVDFETTNYDKCLILPEGDITIEFEGNNTLKAQKATVIYGNHNSNLTLKGINGGTLNIVIGELDSSGNFGLSVSYPKNMTIVSGNINTNGGFYIDDTITIDGGNVKIDTEYMPNEDRTAGIYSRNQVKINNGNIDIKASSNGILVTGAGVAPAEDGIIINGGNISVSSKDKPAICAGINNNINNNKNIVINGGNFTLGGSVGIYANLGNIYVNHIDSLNADNVTNKDEIIKVSPSNTSNKIVYGNADYSKVDEAINRAKKLNKNDYKDFSAVENAIALVIRGKNALAQAEVDVMAKAINDAIDSLELVNRVKNTTALDETIENPDTYDNGLMYIFITLFSVGSLITTVNLYKKTI